MKVHPAFVLIAAIIAANLIGIMGIIIAAPLLASLQVLGRYAMRKLQDKDPWPPEDDAACAASRMPKWLRRIRRWWRKRRSKAVESWASQHHRFPRTRQKINDYCWQGEFYCGPNCLYRRPGGTGSEGGLVRVLWGKPEPIHSSVIARAPVPVLWGKPEAIPQFTDALKRRPPMPKNDPEPKTETLAETESYLAWKADEPDGETTYHLDINNVTLHFFKEEWDEFLELIHSLK